MTNAKIENVVQRERDRGFMPKALVTDYDEKISAPKQRFTEKRFEIDEVYQEYLRLIARYGCIGWMAAQTQRNTRHLKTLSGDTASEDIGKARKAHCALSLGKGDWENDSIYLYVAAHRTEMMEIGTHIIPDKKRSLIYDREATDKARKAHAND